MGLRADVVGTLRSLKGDSWSEATRDAALESIEATMGLFRHEPLVGSELTSKARSIGGWHW